MFTLGAIAIMLLIVYRSVVTTLIQLFLTGIGLASSRGVVAVLGIHNVLWTHHVRLESPDDAGRSRRPPTTGYSSSAVTKRRARPARIGKRPTTPPFAGSLHVVLGSGLTIAGAMYCLSFTRLPVLPDDGRARAPSACSSSVAVALTLGPAVLTVGSRFGLFDPKRATQRRRWRRVGTAVVRWPAPILAASRRGRADRLWSPCPAITTSYNDRFYLPDDMRRPMSGYAAADRHFSPGPDECPNILMIEADHDHAQSGRHARLGQGRQKRLRAFPVSPGCKASPGPRESRSNTARYRFMISMQSSDQTIRICTYHARRAWTTCSKQVR